MGVVHKLKQEVIDYILIEKKNTPQISCRKLAFLATKKFQTKISKSSINSVLKDAKLSSKVGRRKGSRGKKKKFEIPQQKKEQILEQVRELGFVGKNSSEDLSEKKEDKKEKKPETKIQENKNVVSPELPSDPRPQEFLDLSSGILAGKEKKSSPKELKEVSKEIEKEFSREKQEGVFDEKILRSLEQQKELATQKFSPLTPGAGWIFFKIAEWDLFPFLFLQAILSPHLNKAEQDPQALFNTQILLNSYESWGKESLAALTQQAVWGMDVFSSMEKSLRIREKIRAQELSLREQIQCELAFDQVFLKTTHVQIILEDGSELTLDAAARTVCFGSLQRQTASVFYKACSLFSERIISNNQPAVFCVQGVGKSSAEDVNLILSCFEGEAGRNMDKVKMYDPFSRVLAEFSALPRKKRNLILGLSQEASQGDALFAQEDVSLRTPFYSEVSDRIVYYSETIREIDTQEGVRLLRSIILAEEKKENSKVVLVTNINEDPAEKIIELFLKRFPDFYSEPVSAGMGSGLADENPTIGNSSFLDPQILGKKGHNPLSLKDFFQEYSLRVFDYFKETYFTENQRSMVFSDFQELLWEARGGISRSKDFFEVRLELASLGVLTNEIMPTIEKINNADVYTPLGQKVSLKI